MDYILSYSSTEAHTAPLPCRLKSLIASRIQGGEEIVGVLLVCRNEHPAGDFASTSKLLALAFLSKRGEESANQHPALV